MEPDKMTYPTETTLSDLTPYFVLFAIHPFLIWVPLSLQINGTSIMGRNLGFCLFFLCSLFR